MKLNQNQIMKSTNPNAKAKTSAANQDVSPAILTEGTKVTSFNEDPVQSNIIELEPFLKVTKTSRNSNIYEKFE